MRDPGCSPHPRLIRFTIDASRCDLRVGDRVSPLTEIGIDAETGRTVASGCHGEVVSIEFRGASHTLDVIIRTKDNPNGESLNP